MERAKGFEPSTATLARWSSTTELRSLHEQRGRVYENCSETQETFLSFDVLLTVHTF